MGCAARARRASAPGLSRGSVPVVQILVIVDPKPKQLGLPVAAYVCVEEVHDVRAPAQALRRATARGTAAGRLSARLARLAGWHPNDQDV